MYTHNSFPGQGIRRAAGGQEQKAGGPTSPGQKPATNAASTSALVWAKLWKRAAPGVWPSRAAGEAGSPRVAARDVSSSLVITRFWSRGLLLPAAPSRAGRPTDIKKEYVKYIVIGARCDCEALGRHFLTWFRGPRTYLYTVCILRVITLSLQHGEILSCFPNQTGFHPHPRQSEPWHHTITHVLL
jgi:hypothetical protein